MSKLDPCISVKSEFEIMVPSSSYSQLDSPVSDEIRSNTSLAMNDLHKSGSEYDLKPVKRPVCAKRSFSDFEACDSVSSKEIELDYCKRRMTTHCRPQNSVKVYHMTINDDFWASVSNSNFAWGKEHPRGMLVNLFGRLHLPLPQFRWFQVIHGEERELDPKTVHSLSKDLIRGGSLFLEVTYARLDDIDLCTTLRFLAKGTHGDTIHCASVVALAHILFVPAAVPTGYNQNHLYAEARLCFRLEKEPLIHFLSHLAAKINDRNFTVLRSKLFIRAAISADANDLRPKVYHEDIHSVQFLTGARPIKKRATNRSPTFSGSVKRSQQLIPRKTIPKYTYSLDEPYHTHQRSMMGKLLPQLSAHSLSTKPTEGNLNFKAKYVQVEADVLKGIEENDDEKTLREEFRAAPFDDGVLLESILQQVIQDISDSPTGCDYPYTQLFEIWKLRKNETIRILLSLPSPPVLWLLRRKIEYDCADTRILFKVVTMMTQLLASTEDPKLVAPKLIDYDFMEHVHAMIQWISKFDSYCEVAKTGITLLSRLFMLCYDSATETRHEFLFSTLPNSNKSLVTLAGYCHASHWIEQTYERISSWVSKNSNTVPEDNKRWSLRNSF